jgi:hypothetical protein
MLKRTRTLLGSLTAAAVMAFAPAGAVADAYWQCVPFARLISGIQIFGDARTWWQQAIGRYETGVQPQTGAVLCFKPTARMRLGHVAVVSQVLTDWSQVKVWYDPNRDLGGSTYAVHGFIYPDATARVIAASGMSRLQSGAIAVAQSAASQMASAVRPGQGAMSVLSQAADSTDAIAALISAALRGDNTNPR